MSQNPISFNKRPSNIFESSQDGQFAYGRPPLKRRGAIMRGRRALPERALAKANAALKKLKQIENSVESKWWSVSDTITASAAWQVIGSDFLAVPQGDTNIARDGNQITLTSVEVRWQARLDTDPCAGRFVLVLWLDDAAPTLPLPFTTDGLLINVDPDYKNKMVVLKDWSYVVDDGHFWATGHMVIPISRKLNFASSSTTNPNNRTLALYTIAETASAAFPLIETNVEIRFTDA